MPSTPHTSGALARRIVGALEAGIAVGPSASTRDLSYHDIGNWDTWELMPAEIVSTLQNAGCEPATAFNSGTVPPRVRKRGSEFLQRAHAWAVSTSGVVLVAATRPLKQVTKGSFMPAGPWSLKVGNRSFVDQPRRRTGTVAADAQPGSSMPTRGADGSPERPAVVNLLPAPVRRQVVATVPSPEIDHDYVFQFTERNKASRNEVGLIRVGMNVMITVIASREIKPSLLRSGKQAERALDQTAWTVDTLVAQLGQESTMHLEASESKTLAVRPSRRRYSSIT
jgi:hypothetical protein